MYGSSFWSVTRRPRLLSNRPSDEAVSPLPRLDATPPVTKMCFVNPLPPPSVRGREVLLRNGVLDPYAPPAHGRSTVPCGSPPSWFLRSRLCLVAGRRFAPNLLASTRASLRLELRPGERRADEQSAVAALAGRGAARARRAPDAAAVDVRAHPARLRRRRL